MPASTRPRTVGVLVLSDVGRSPRMQYHAQSIVTEFPDCNVELIGYAGSTCFPEIEQNVHIRKILFTPYSPTLHATLPAPALLLLALCKTVVQLLQLLYILMFTMSNVSALMVQTPPAIPTLLVVYIVSTLRNIPVLIDYHNFGYTLLSIKFNSKTHPLVRLSYYYEHYIGYLASDKALCVTKAMQKYLQQTAPSIQATVLHDTPPAHFAPLGTEQIHQLWLRLERENIVPTNELYAWLDMQRTASTTILTTTDSQKQVTLRTDRPALLISSTSWTPDEDFSILLQALIAYNNIAKSTSTSTLPKLLCLITGRGPQREQYEQQIKTLQLTHVRIVTLFVAASDYPLLLGSTDLGISLHQSSSNLDLPMKVVDMYGCGLSVCAINFECLHELVEDKVTGAVFNNSQELTAQLETLLKQWPKTPQLDQYRSTIIQRYGPDRRWQHTWQTNAKPIVQQLLTQKQTSVKRSTLVFYSASVVTLATMIASLVALR